jgi:hypothetical protein
MAHSISLKKRKVHYASRVKVIMPNETFQTPAIMGSACTISDSKAIYLWHKMLDNSCTNGIIRLTLKLSYLGELYHGRLWRCKNAVSWAKWHFKHTLCLCYGRVVFGQRILRSSRSGASQIRNASAGSGRWTTCFEGIKNVRLFPGFILSDTTFIQPTRISRSYASSARAQTCSQVNRRCNGIYFCTQKQRCFLAGDRFGESDKTTVWLERPSTQYRASVATPAKKRAIVFFESDTCLSHCVDRYEQLRRMALEGRDSCGQGWGLALLHQRGFLVWMDAFSKIESYQQHSVIPVTSVPDKTYLAVPDTIRGQMIVTISEMVLSTLKGAAL